jgi:hypothetical protein
MPTGQESLIATVDGTLGTIAIPPPSGGFPVGGGFQVNFVKDPQDLNTILAQSGQFNITQSNSTSSTSLASNTFVYVFFFVPLAPMIGHKLTHFVQRANRRRHQSFTDHGHFSPKPD